MELTIVQALQQGITAHKEGKLQDAERLYRTILQSQPSHPDANHNLGVLAVSVNKVDVALSFFKSALEANPKIEQFWVSYIDALVKAKRLKEAKQAIEKAKKKGFDAKKLQLLLSQSKVIAGTKVPSQTQVNTLLEHYQNGRFGDAEELAISVTQEFPQHQYAWKVLGAIFAQTGRKSEALNANQTAIALSPEDAEAHSNLGNTLKELGRLDEAEASYTQAIALKPDFAEAHSNLGNTLIELGRLNEAEASYTQAIALKPDFTEAQNNLGNTLKELGRLDEAEASYTQAIALKPDFAQAHFNLGITLQELGRLDEAEASYTQAITLKPDFAEAHSKLGVTLKELGRLDEAEASYTQAIALKPDYGDAHSNLGLMLQELGRLEEAIYHFDLGGSKAVSKSLECLYINKNYAEFNRRIDSISELDPKNIGVAAISAFVAHQMKRKDPYPFCVNPLDFILNRNLLEYDQNANTLMDEIIQEADKYKLVWESRTTKCGFQGSPDFFENPSENTAHLESIVLKAVDDYYNRFKHEPNSLIELWPEKRKVTGWYNRLLKNGYHTAHIHNGGWLSGVIYLKTVDSFDKDEGAIEFSLHGYNLPIIDENYPRKLHRPKRGDIILFPSSLFHRTIPFTQDTERCVVAFDVKQI